MVEHLIARELMRNAINEMDPVDVFLQALAPAGVMCVHVDAQPCKKSCARTSKKVEPKKEKPENRILAKVEKVIFNDPVTVVFWKDGTRTTVKCTGDEKYDPEKGLAMAAIKKMLGNKYDYYNDVQEVVEMFTTVEPEKEPVKETTKESKKTTKSDTSKKKAAKKIEPKKSNK